MRKSCLYFILVCAILIIVWNVLMGIFFSLTTIGLTTQERDMLIMTAGQIGSMYAQGQSLVIQLQAVQNVTANLTFLDQQLEILRSVHNANVETTTTVLTQSTQQEQDLNAFNSTIDVRFEIVDEKINNVTIPDTFNLTLFDNTTTIFNGTVVLANPNQVLENVVLEYIVKEQLNSTFIELGPASSSFLYSTTGAAQYLLLYNWAPPLFSDTTAPFSGFTAGQILDNQRDKVSVIPKLTGRTYIAVAPGVQEIRLELQDPLIISPQVVSLQEKLQINVGFI